MDVMHLLLPGCEAFPSKRRRKTRWIDVLDCWFVTRCAATSTNPIAVGAGACPPLESRLPTRGQSPCILLVAVAQEDLAADK